jgi:hypothetical protein
VFYRRFGIAIHPILHRAIRAAVLLVVTPVSLVVPPTVFTGTVLLGTIVAAVALPNYLRVEKIAATVTATQVDHMISLSPAL